MILFTRVTNSWPQMISLMSSLARCTYALVARFVSTTQVAINLAFFTSMLPLLFPEHINYECVNRHVYLSFCTLRQTLVVKTSMCLNGIKHKNINIKYKSQWDIQESLSLPGDFHKLVISPLRRMCCGAVDTDCQNFDWITFSLLQDSFQDIFTWGICRKRDWDSGSFACFSGLSQPP